ncbi:MAG: hypothetical protein H7Z38_14565 [Rubrivivax sp.]|nr:hypothetical protein [Pyrinomonadaceae bacterium]
MLTRLMAALASPVDDGKDARELERRAAAKERERQRVITWARQDRITEGELDAQLGELRRDLDALAEERARLEGARESSDSMRESLSEAERFLDEIAGRLHSLSPEEKAAILRRAVPHVKVTPREDGLRSVVATYRLSPRSVIATGVY